MSFTSTAAATPEARFEPWDVMDLNEVARVTHRSRRTVERWIAKKKLRVAWHGRGRGRTYVWTDDVEALRRELRQASRRGGRSRNGIVNTTAITH